MFVTWWSSHCERNVVSFIRVVLFFLHSGHNVTESISSRVEQTNKFKSMATKECQKEWTICTSIRLRAQRTGRFLRHFRAGKSETAVRPCKLASPRFAARLKTPADATRVETAPLRVGSSLGGLKALWNARANVECRLSLLQSSKFWKSVRRSDTEMKKPAGIPPKTGAIKDMYQSHRHGRSFR